MIKIIDNFLTKSYHNSILNLISGDRFNWMYNANITAPDQMNHLNEYGFSHSLWRENRGPDSGYSSFIEPMLYQILDVANCDLIFRARADMVTWSGGKDFIHPAHIDFPFPNVAAIFYVNESDGDTIFYNVKPADVPNYKDLKEYDRASPKANRLVIFDGDLLHTGCSPTKHKNRILINSNFDKSKVKNNLRSVHSQNNNETFLTEELPRLPNLSLAPSPYLMGKLDEFFDGKLVPLIQTNRGCPFSCTFCVKETDRCHYCF